MRVGLIGAGRVASVHAGSLSRHPAVDGVTVFDVARENAERLAGESGGLVADSIDDVLDAVDAVVIASPTNTHADLLLEATERRLPALCEKPMALTLPEADRVVAAVEATGTPVQIGFMRRFDDGYRRAHELVASGDLGEVLLVTAHTHDPEPPPDDYITRSGGAFKDMLIHDIDAARFVTGREVVNVFATGSNHTMRFLDRHADLGTAGAIAHLDDGSVAILSGTRRDPLGYDVRMEVFGTRDSVAVGLDPHSPIRSLEPGAPPPLEPITAGWVDRFRRAYVGEVHAFIEMIKGEQPSPCTPADARAALAVAEACRRSVESGRPVAMAAA